jgi:hypothetical protein
VIGVPVAASPTPRPSSTPPPTAPPTATTEPITLPLGIQGVSDAACKGAGVTLAVFVGIGLFFALKGGLASLVRGLVQRARESAGLYEK